MLERVEHPKVSAEARGRITGALKGSIDVTDAWLASVCGVALIEESARSPDEDQAVRLARTLDRFGDRQLIAVATEELAGTDVVYRLAATTSDLVDFARARSGLNYALFPAAGLRWLVICTSHDFLLVAGPRTFVDTYAGEPARIAAEFRAFVSDDPEWRHPEKQAVLRHLEWADGT